MTTDTYDANGNTTSSAGISDTYDFENWKNQKTTTYAYDDADRLVSVTDAANNITQYAYDTEDNQLLASRKLGKAPRNARD